MMLCDILEWDSAFFGRRIARYLPARCVGDAARALAAECAERAIECVYVLIDAADAESIANLQRMQAFLADVRLTFDAKISLDTDRPTPVQTISHVRRACESDIPALRRIASESHRDTRFYADAHFPSKRCDCLYETWIENSCLGYADAVLVADDAAKPVGYVTCHKSGSGGGHIGLFAVEAQHERCGTGTSLLHGARAWFSANDVRSMRVSTQLRNLRAVRFYGRDGLLVETAHFWFHYWPLDAHA
jgi:dTDP-4-amino-4,6-dideoxy-D-galactose acyltransferase